MGMEPCDVGPVEERDQRAQRRAAEQALMDRYHTPADYAAVCRVLHAAPPDDGATPYQAEGEVFARLIGRE